jgi:magnesium transporter
MATRDTNGDSSASGKVSPGRLQPPTAEAFHAAVDAGDLRRAGGIASALPAVELRDAVRSLTADQAEALVREFGPAGVAALLRVLDWDDVADILRRLPEPQAADVIEQLAPDDAADVVGAIGVAAPDVAEAILVEMESEEADDVRALLAYPPQTAGGRMTPEFFAVTPQVTAGEALQALRALVGGEGFRSYVYVTDHVDRLLGVVSLYRLIFADPDSQVGELMLTDPLYVRDDTDQEDVARIYRSKRLLALPVVDAELRLLGVITADDIADVLEAETTEDVQRLGASEPLDQPYLRAAPFTLARKRIVWLLLLFFGAAYTGTVMHYFEADLEATVALAFFVPLLIGTGGNVGSQTVMTVTRALAVGQVSPGDLVRVWVKEATTGLILGVAIALAAFVRALFLGVGIQIGFAVALAAAVIVVWAATVAAILPLILHRIRIDPAVVSAPLITTLVDGTGLFLYFIIARLLLHR